MTQSRAYEKAALAQLLIALVEANRPETMLACLKRVAEYRAFGVTKGAIEPDEAERWMALAEALRTVERSLERAA